MGYTPYGGKFKGRQRFKENPWTGTLRNVLGSLVTQGAQFGLGQLGNYLGQGREDEVLNTKLEQQRLGQEAADKRTADTIASSEKIAQGRADERAAAVEREAMSAAIARAKPVTTAAGMSEDPYIRQRGAAIASGVHPRGFGLKVTKDGGVPSFRPKGATTAQQTGERSSDLASELDPATVKMGIPGFPGLERQKMRKEGQTSRFKHEKEMAGLKHRQISTRQKQKQRARTERDDTRTRQKADIKAFNVAIEDTFGLQGADRIQGELNRFSRKYPRGGSEMRKEISKLSKAGASEDQILDFIKENEDFYSESG